MSDELSASGSETSCTAAADYHQMAVIKEVYGENTSGSDATTVATSRELSEMELEKALAAGCKSIVIESSALGDETARWIRVGNSIHCTVIVTGACAFVTGLLQPEMPLLPLPLGLSSCFLASLYYVSWQFDPCCQYQVEEKKKVSSSSTSAAEAPAAAATTAAAANKGKTDDTAAAAATANPSPVVLIKVGDTHVRNRVIVQSVAAISSLAFCLWRFISVRGGGGTISTVAAFIA